MTDRPHASRFDLEYADERRAVVVARSIRQEVGEIDDDRSRTTIDRERARVAVAVEAADLVALRAAGNTWLSLASVAERSADAGETVPF